MIDKAGTVYLVGAGPGDPGLITVKGRDCLRRAEVVVYDYLANPAFLAEAPAAAEKIYVGKTKGHHCRPQDEINHLLAERALAGKTVVRLKGGDPFIFGRGGEEARHLAAAGIPFEVVPGITAGLAAASYAGIPLTHRDYTTSLGMVTGHLNAQRDLDHVDWEHLAKGVGTLVIYMGISNLADITDRLVRAGRPPQTPVAVIRWATLPAQDVLTGTLADIADQVISRGFQPPAVIIIGEVVGLRAELAWFDRRPLFGKRILVTRTAAQAGSFGAALAARGAVPVLCPTITIVPPADYTELDAAQDDLGRFDYLVLTSANAVEAFFSRLDESGQDCRALCDLCVVTVGPKTAEALAAHGIKADLVAADYRAEGIVELLRERVAGKHVLYPRAALARDLIIAQLTAAGAEVAAPVAYASAPPAGAAEQLAQDLDAGLDLLTFTAASTVRNLVELLDAGHLARARRIPVASIGPLTTEACRQHGFEVVSEPRDSTLDALIDAIVDYYAGKRDAERGTS